MSVGRESTCEKHMNQFSVFISTNDSELWFEMATRGSKLDKKESERLKADLQVRVLFPCRPRSGRPARSRRS